MSKIIFLIAAIPAILFCMAILALAHDAELEKYMKHKNRFRV